LEQCEECDNVTRNILVPFMSSSHRPTVVVLEMDIDIDKSVLHLNRRQNRQAGAT